MMNHPTTEITVEDTVEKDQIEPFKVSQQNLINVLSEIIENESDSRDDVVELVTNFGPRLRAELRDREVL
jgi:hypothetical protein